MFKGRILAFVWILSFFCVLEKSFADQDAVFVSLGSTCEVCFQFMKNDVRSKAYPFDWITSRDHGSFHRALGERLANFLNIKYLQMKGQKAFNDRYQFNFFHDVKPFLAR